MKYAVIFFMLLSFFSFSQSLAQGVSTQVEPSSKLVLEVSGMTCGSCAKAITRSLKSNPAVKSVEVDVDSGLVSLVVDKNTPISSEELKKLVKAAGGYNLDKVR